MFSEIYIVLANSNARAIAKAKQIGKGSNHQLFVIGSCTEFELLDREQRADTINITETDDAPIHCVVVCKK